MKISDSLFRLIKSLSKNEKGYFKRLSSLHKRKGGNKYLALFDAIDNQKVYDENKLRLKFANQAFTRQFHVAKNYLFNLILECSEHFQSSLDARLRGYLAQVEFLSEKHLYKEAEKLLLKAQKTAEKYERFTVLLDIRNIENKLMRRQSYATRSPEKMKATYEAELDALAKYSNVIEYRYLSSSFFMHIYKKGGAPRNLSDKNRLNELIHNPLFSSDKKTLSYRSAFLFYLGKSTYYHIMADHKRAHSSMKKLVSLYETHPWFIQYNQGEYHGALKNLMASSSNLRKYEDFYSSIEKLKAQKIKSEHIRYQNFHSISYSLMTVLINEGKFEEGMALVKNILKEIRENNYTSLFKKNETVLNYCFAYICLGSENYKKANLYLNKILDNKAGLRAELYSAAKLLNIIVLYEIQKLDVLDSRVRSTYRYLAQQKRLNRFEMLFLKFMQNTLPKIKTGKELTTGFTKLKRDLKKAVAKPKDNFAAEYFDYDAWLESKIENKKFADIVKEKMK